MPAVKNGPERGPRAVLQVSLVPRVDFRSSSMQHRTLWAFVSFLALAVAAACGGSDAPADAPAEPAAPAFDPATAGSVTGSIMFEGEAPAAETIRMNSDPVCVKAATDTETDYYVVGEGGGLGNVFVYVKSELPGSFPPASDTVSPRPAGLPLHAARLRRAGGADAADRQQRSDAAQHPRDPREQPRVQHRAADPGDDVRPDVRQRRDHGPLQVRRARLDERLRRRARSSVLHGDGKRRLVRHQRSPAGDAHHRGVARGARHAGDGGHGSRRAGRPKRRSPSR